MTEVLHVWSQQPVPAHSRLLPRTLVHPQLYQLGRLVGHGPEPQKLLHHFGGQTLGPPGVRTLSRPQNPYQFWIWNWVEERETEVPIVRDTVYSWFISRILLRRDEKKRNSILVRAVPILFGWASGVVLGKAMLACLLVDWYVHHTQTDILYLKQYWMHCYKILFTHSWWPEAVSYWLFSNPPVMPPSFLHFWFLKMSHVAWIGITFSTSYRWCPKFEL